MGEPRVRQTCCGAEGQRQEQGGQGIGRTDASRRERQGQRSAAGTPLDFLASSPREPLRTFAQLSFIDGGGVHLGSFYDVGGRHFDSVVPDSAASGSHVRPRIN